MSYRGKAQVIATACKELLYFYEQYVQIIEVVRTEYPLELSGVGPTLAVPFHRWGPLSYAVQGIIRSYDALAGDVAPVNYYRDYFWVYSPEFGQEIPISLMAESPIRKFPRIKLQDACNQQEVSQGGGVVNHG